MTTTTRTYKTTTHAARAWAKRNGVEGRVGGWIYRVKAQRPICQGWDVYASILLSRGKIALVDPKRPWDTAYIVEG